jgi:hypothetical protein
LINSYKENIIFQKKSLLALFLFIYILLVLPFLGNVAFDGVVHFVVAEKFAEGHPFQYNIDDVDKSIASTSPFWTILLTFYQVRCTIDVVCKCFYREKFLRRTGEYFMLTSTDYNVCLPLEKPG